MSYCLNPNCQAPQNSTSGSCHSCGTALKLGDRYQVLKPIGQGGFGRTFLAVDLSQSLKPRCAIKQLYPRQQGLELQVKAAELFRQEAQQLAALDHHPSMPKFLDYFEQDGYQYLIQEFIEGQNLAEVVAEGRIFTEAEVRELLETMLETVDFLHQRHIIHRDIKPANIIQTPIGRFVLVDLGAVKVLTGTALGQTGTMIGSAEYVAPEQLRGKAIFASDLYSLGATCVTMLTGMSPFSLFDTSTGAWEWRDYLASRVSDRLGKTLDRMLLGPTKQRYSSAEEVLRTLEEGRQGLVRQGAIDPWDLPEEDPKGRRWLWETMVKTEEKAPDFQADLGIETIQAGKVEEIKESDRTNPDRWIIGKILMVPIAFAILAFVSRPNQSDLSTEPLATKVSQGNRSIPTLRRRPIDPINAIIKPTYTRTVRPFKVFTDIPPFRVLGLRDDNKTLVTAYPPENNKVLVNQLDMQTGSKKISKLESPFGASRHSISLRGDNLIYVPSHDRPKDLFKQNDPQTTHIFNLKSNSFVPISPELGTKGIRLLRGGRGILSQDSNYDYDLSHSIWQILPDGKLEKIRAGNVPIYIASDDLQHIVAGDKTLPKLLDLTPNRSTERILEVPILLKNGYATSLYESPHYPDFFKKGKHEFMVSTLSGDKQYTLAEIYNFLPAKYRNRIPEALDKRVQYGENTIHFLDLKTGKLRYVIPRTFFRSNPIISPDGNTMFLIEAGSVAKLTVWDTLTGEFLREVNLSHMTNSAFNRDLVEFTPDGKRMVIAESYGKFNDQGADPYISVWDIEELRNP